MPFSTGDKDNNEDGSECANGKYQYGLIKSFKVIQ